MGGHWKNCTEHPEFHLVAFSRSVKLQFTLFSGTLLVYMLAIVGNIVITILVCLVPQLHTPMYAFLCNLSVQDIIYVSAILPKFLVITITGDTRISFLGCITQMFLFVFCVGTEFLLLTSMAYDRYVAICIPLHYALIMSRRTCIILAAVSWLIGFLDSLAQSWMVVDLACYSIQDINHFYCDLKAMIKLSSSDTKVIRTFLSVVCVVLGFLPFMLILTSYAFIISTIVKIRTTTGRVKAFSSCSSHLIVVILFYGTSLVSYMKPESEASQEEDKLLSLIYTAVVPMLNPIVYSLRNQEVLRSIKNIGRKCSTCKLGLPG
ncbi:olfactory receptor 5V1-like [Spea bombifrons]|uniref:olfactory receptor 5V1-like n=1 Tax=Spea bombifrons TaxID=233779 RepID=UPI00234A2146|nr:olfactory receptor 5V1-like [Spea bombifrons]